MDPGDIQSAGGDVSQTDRDTMIYETAKRTMAAVLNETKFPSTKEMRAIIQQPTLSPLISSEEETEVSQAIMGSQDYLDLGTSLQLWQGLWHLDIPSLAKVFLRIYDMMPQRLLSSEFRLQAPVYPLSGRPRHPFMLQKDFSEKLSELAVHPLFAGKRTPTFLALALQFTSLCRTRDTRPWKMLRLEPANPQIEQLDRKVFVNTSFTPKGPWEWVKQLFGEEMNQSEEINLLISIMSPMPPFIRENGEEPAPNLYKLCEGDLDHLARAVDSMPSQVKISQAQDFWPFTEEYIHGSKPKINMNDIKLAYEHITKLDILQRRFIADSVDEERRQARMDNIFLGKLAVNPDEIGQARFEAMVMVLKRLVSRRYHWMEEVEFSLKVDEEMWGLMCKFPSLLYPLSTKPIQAAI